MDVRPIPSLPGYFCDETGNLYSQKARNPKEKPPDQPRLKAAPLDDKGYHRACFWRDGRQFSRRVGTLVLETFVGPRPRGMQCCHGPLGPGNDSLQNLTWGTMSKNMGEDKIRDGTSNRGERCGIAKLSPDKIKIIRRNPENKSQRGMARQFGVHHKTIAAVLKGRTWGWLSD